MPRRGPPTVAKAQHRVTRIDRLTQQQRRVVDLLGVGMFNAEIAAELGTSIKTIDTHRAMVLSRLGLRNNVELVLLAIRQGVLPDPRILGNYYPSMPVTLPQHDVTVTKEFVRAAARAYPPQRKEG